MEDNRVTRDGRIVDNRRSGSGWLIGLLVIVLLVVAAFAFGLIDVDQTQKAVAPTVSVEGGQAPAFDVDTADVDVGSKTETVEVPTVEVKPADEK
jgi:hypothetical protein